MSRGMWKIVETETRKIRIEKNKRRKEKRGGRKEIRGEGGKEEKRRKSK